VVHDSNEFTVKANRPVALQVDGEGLGLVTEVTARAVPRALRVIV
jgi:hypothetical protein